MAADQHQPGIAACNDVVKSGEQNSDLALASVEAFRHHQAIRVVGLAQWELVDHAASLPFAQAAPEVAFDAGGGLVTLLGILREQLHDDRRELSGNPVE